MSGVVVTGASSGIGRAIAIALATADPQRRILVHYRENRSGAEETAESVRQTGATCELIAADLSNSEDVQRLADESFRSLGKIEAWVNNAGADVLTGATAQHSFDQKLQQLWEVDVRGTIQLTRLVGPRLVKQGSGSIIFMGWDQCLDGMEGDAGMMFGPIKAAVTSFANSCAQTYAPQVRVNTVAPGWIQTSWGESTSDYWDRRAKRDSLMQRWGKPADVAATVSFLCSPGAQFVSGQVVSVNGGWNRVHHCDS